MSPTSIETTKAPKNDAPKYSILQKNTFKNTTKKNNGSSPYAEKYKEGPSYQPSTLYLEPSGDLDREYEFDEITPQIGREYPTAKISDILKDKKKLQDLAITVSRRGVVFFRNQDITVEEQKILADELGKLTHKPKTSGLHIHPTAPAGGFFKDDDSEETDPEVSIISSKLSKELYIKNFTRGKRSGEGWHSDITFESVTSDYAVLKIVESTPTGGDTLWASGYALYEKLTPTFRSYLETLTGVYSQPGFKKASEGKFEIYSGVRGAPENVGDELTAVHPLVRTNPVTGWKSIFSIGHHFTSINGLSDSESALIKDYLSELLYGSHDIQVRFRWNKNDVAIWDNRSVYHTATNDYFNDAFERTGVRTVGIGERPYLDANSSSRDEALNGYQNLT